MAEKLKSFYFRHDENASNDIKMLALRSQLSMEGYGIYWFMIEQLSMAGGKMPLKMVPMLAAVMQTTPDKAMSVVKNYDLFEVDGDGFFSERLNKELAQRGVLSEAGRVAGLKSAEKRKLKALPPTTVERPLNDSPTTVQPEEKRREEKSIEDKRIEESLPSVETDLDRRLREFKKSIYDAGQLTYTKVMLDDFVAYWSEPNRAKNPKMRFELEKTWKPTLRLGYWSRKEQDYVCLLTDSQRTIKQKQHEFSIQLEKYLEKYGKNTLNEFYKYWGQPENKPEPGRIRWEMEEFWDLPQRLSQWASRNPKKA